MKRYFATALVTSMLVMTGSYALAEDLTDTDPVRVDDLANFSDDARTAYIIGGLQALGYILSDDNFAGSACVTGLTDQVYENMIDAEGTEMMAIIMEDTAGAYCEEQTGEAGGLITASDMVEWMAEAEDLSRASLVLGVTDAVHFRAFAGLPEEKSDCVRKTSLGAIYPDSQYWRVLEGRLNAEPDGPFVEQMVLTPLRMCN